MSFYGISVIFLQREAKRNNFEMKLFYGTYNAILYYKETKRRGERISKRFWFYIFSSLNLVLSMITFLISVIL